MANLSDYFGPVGSTAEQWDIKNGKTAYIASGKVTGSGYFPAMMQFDGSTGWYSDSFTASGNKVVFVGSLIRSAFTGGGTERLEKVDIGGVERGSVFVVSSDHAITGIRSKIGFIVRNSGSTIVCLLYSDVVVADGARHTFYAEFDGDAGTGKLWIDGADADDTGNASRVAPTTGTLSTGAATFLVGSNSPAGALFFGGSMGFVGHHETSGLTPGDFMQTDGTPKNIESTLNTVWGGGAPLFWHESAKMDENKGSAGAMTKNGTITLAAAS